MRFENKYFIKKLNMVELVWFMVFNATFNNKKLNIRLKKQEFCLELCGLIKIINNFVQTEI